MFYKLQNNYQPTTSIDFPPSPTAPDDYIAVLNRTVIFGPSDKEQNIQVIVNNDGIAEESEMFLGRLSLPANSSDVTISSRDATATITNGDKVHVLPNVTFGCYSVGLSSLDHFEPNDHLLFAC